MNDVSGLTAADYKLSFDGTNYTLVNLSTKVSQPLLGAGPFNVDGLTLTMAGSPNAGDQFEIHPTRNGAESIGVRITDVREIAAAAPIRTNAGTANQSDAVVSAGEVIDVTDPNLLNTTTLTFLTASTYSVNGAGSFAYNSGANIDLNGSRIQISGSPAIGDVFTIQSNTNGAGDNRNAIRLSGIQNQGVIAGGSTSVFEAYHQIVSSVGTKTRQLNVNATAQSVILGQSIDAKESVSGVNLDEEGANLVRLQQSYTASAQLISVANTIFQTLIQAVSR